MTDAPTPTISRRDVGLRSERGPILLSLMMSTGLIAIDATILATAVPSVVHDLGGFSSFPWLFSIYLLAQAVSVPIYSKLADTIGRKPMLLTGIGIFFVGSVLCGFAPTMTLLIVFRAIQGLGAGAILPMSVTIAGDIYTVAERAKAQGYLASVWAIASVVGPTLGGVFTQYVSWRWIFFVNVPLCALAAVLLIRSYSEKIERRQHSVDYAGAVTLTVGLAALLLALLEGGTGWAWSSVQSIGSFVIAAVLLAAFVFIERRAKEPILPLWVFSRRLLLTTALISTGVGAVLTGLTSYVPNFLQVDAGATPLVSGLALAGLTIGWPIAASNAGRLYLRFGFRLTVLVGAITATVGAVALVLVAPAHAVIPTAIVCFLVGLGLGLVATPSLIAAQSSVGWDERAVVSGTNLFARSVGSAVGVAIFGAIANGVLASTTGSNAQGTSAASSAVFLAVVVGGVLTIVAALFLPRKDAPAAAAGDAGGAPNQAQHA